MSETMKLKDAIESFLRYLELDQGYSQNTIRLYRASLADFLAAVGDITLKKVTHDKVLAYREGLLKKKASHKTRNLKIIPIRRLFAFLKIRGVEVAPFEIESFKNRNGHEQLALPDQKSLDKFLAPEHTFPEETDVVVQLIYTTGLRLAELTSLKVGQVQRKFSIVGKGAKERFVACPASTVALIRKYEQHQCLSKNDLVFPPSGRRMIQRAIQLRAQKHGFENFSVHTLRHCYATYLLSQGMDIRLVQELLGHASLVTTQRYTHVTNEQLSEAVDKVFK